MAFINQQYSLIWYGVCPDTGLVDENCAPSPIANYSESIEAVWQLNSASSAKSWVNGSSNNSFDTFFCGHAYYIKLFNNVDSLNLEHAKVSDFGTTNRNFAISGTCCSGTANFLPSTPTPTPNISTTVLDASVNGSCIDVTWQRVNGASGYELYRSVADGDFVLYDGILESGQNLIYKDCSVNHSIEYCYKIKVITFAGNNSIFSNVDCATVPAPTPTPEPPPPQPTLQLDFSGSCPFLNWTAVSGSSYYEVHRKINAFGADFEFLSDTQSLSYVDCDVAYGGTEYCYRVRGISSVAGDFSNEVCAVTYSTPTKTATPTTTSTTTTTLTTSPTSTSSPAITHTKTQSPTTSTTITATLTATLSICPITPTPGNWLVSNLDVGLTSNDSQQQVSGQIKSQTFVTDLDNTEDINYFSSSKSGNNSSSEIPIDPQTGALIFYKLPLVDNSQSDSHIPQICKICEETIGIIPTDATYNDSRADSNSVKYWNGYLILKQLAEFLDFSEEFDQKINSVYNYSCLDCGYGLRRGFHQDFHFFHHFEEFHYVGQFGSSHGYYLFKLKNDSSNTVYIGGAENPITSHNFSGLPSNNLINIRPIEIALDFERNSFGYPVMSGNYKSDNAYNDGQNIKGNHYYQNFISGGILTQVERIFVSQENTHGIQGGSSPQGHFSSPITFQKFDGSIYQIGPTYAHPDFWSFNTKNCENGIMANSSINISNFSGSDYSNHDIYDTFELNGSDGQGYDTSTTTGDFMDGMPIPISTYAIERFPEGTPKLKSVSSFRGTIESELSDSHLTSFLDDEAWINKPPLLTNFYLFEDGELYFDGSSFYAGLHDYSAFDDFDSFEDAGWLTSSTNGLTAKTVYRNTSAHTSVNNYSINSLLQITASNSDLNRVDFWQMALLNPGKHLSTSNTNDSINFSIKELHIPSYSVRNSTGGSLDPYYQSLSIHVNRQYRLHEVYGLNINGKNNIIPNNFFAYKPILHPLTTKFGSVTDLSVGISSIDEYNHLDFKFNPANQNNLNASQNYAQYMLPLTFIASVGADRDAVFLSFPNCAIKDGSEYNYWGYLYEDSYFYPDQSRDQLVSVKHDHGSIKLSGIYDISRLFSECYFLQKSTGKVFAIGSTNIPDGNAGHYKLTTKIDHDNADYRYAMKAVKKIDSNSTDPDNPYNLSDLDNAEDIKTTTYSLLVKTRSNDFTPAPVSSIVATSTITQSRKNLAGCITDIKFQSYGVGAQSIQIPSDFKNYGVNLGSTFFQTSEGYTFSVGAGTKKIGDWYLKNITDISTHNVDRDPILLFPHKNINLDNIYFKNVNFYQNYTRFSGSPSNWYDSMPTQVFWVHDNTLYGTLHTPNSEGDSLYYTDHLYTYRDGYVYDSYEKLSLVRYKDPNSGATGDIIVNSDEVLELSDYIEEVIEDCIDFKSLINGDPYNFAPYHEARTFHENLIDCNTCEVGSTLDIGYEAFTSSMDSVPTKATHTDNVYIVGGQPIMNNVQSIDMFHGILFITNLNGEVLVYQYNDYQNLSGHPRVAYNDQKWKFFTSQNRFIDLNQKNDEYHFGKFYKISPQATGVKKVSSNSYALLRSDRMSNRFGGLSTNSIADSTFSDRGVGPNMLVFQRSDDSLWFQGSMGYYSNDFTASDPDDDSKFFIDLTGELSNASGSIIETFSRAKASDVFPGVTLDPDDWDDPQYHNIYSIPLKKDGVSLKVKDFCVVQQALVYLDDQGDLYWRGNLGSEIFGNSNFNEFTNSASVDKTAHTTTDLLLASNVKSFSSEMNDVLFAPSTTMTSTGDLDRGTIRKLSGSFLVYLTNDGNLHGIGKDWEGFIFNQVNDPANSVYTYQNPALIASNIEKFTCDTGGKLAYWDTDGNIWGNKTFGSNMGGHKWDAYLSQNKTRTGVSYIHHLGVTANPDHPYYIENNSDRAHFKFHDVSKHNLNSNITPRECTSDFDSSTNIRNDYQYPFVVYTPTPEFSSTPTPGIVEAQEEPTDDQLITSLTAGSMEALYTNSGGHLFGYGGASSTPENEECYPSSTFYTTSGVSNDDIYFSAFSGYTQKQVSESCTGDIHYIDNDVSSVIMSPCSFVSGYIKNNGDLYVSAPGLHYSNSAYRATPDITSISISAPQTFPESGELSKYKYTNLYTPKTNYVKLAENVSYAYFDRFFILVIQSGILKFTGSVGESKSESSRLFQSGHATSLTQVSTQATDVKKAEINKSANHDYNRLFFLKNNGDLYIQGFNSVEDDVTGTLTDPETEDGIWYNTSAANPSSSTTSDPSTYYAELIFSDIVDFATTSGGLITLDGDGNLRAYGRSYFSFIEESFSSIWDGKLTGDIIAQNVESFSCNSSVRMGNDTQTIDVDLNFKDALSGESVCFDTCIYKTNDGNLYGIGFNARGIFGNGTYINPIDAYNDDIDVTSLNSSNISNIGIFRYNNPVLIDSNVDWFQQSPTALMYKKQGLSKRYLTGDSYGGKFIRNIYNYNVPTSWDYEDNPGSAQVFNNPFPEEIADLSGPPINTSACITRFSAGGASDMMYENSDGHLFGYGGANELSKSTGIEFISDTSANAVYIDKDVTNFMISVDADSTNGGSIYIKDGDLYAFGDNYLFLSTVLGDVKTKRFSRLIGNRTTVGYTSTIPSNSNILQSYDYVDFDIKTAEYEKILSGGVTGFHLDKLSCYAIQDGVLKACGVYDYQSVPGRSWEFYPMNNSGEDFVQISPQATNVKKVSGSRAFYGGYIYFQKNDNTLWAQGFSYNYGQNQINLDGTTYTSGSYVYTSPPGQNNHTALQVLDSNGSPLTVDDFSVVNGALIYLKNNNLYIHGKTSLMEYVRWEKSTGSPYLAFDGPHLDHHLVASNIASFKAYAPNTSGEENYIIFLTTDGKLYGAGTNYAGLFGNGILSYETHWSRIINRHSLVGHRWQTEGVIPPGYPGTFSNWNDYYPNLDNDFDFEYNYPYLIAENVESFFTSGMSLMWVDATSKKRYISGNSSGLRYITGAGSSGNYNYGDLANFQVFSDSSECS